MQVITCTRVLGVNAFNLRLAFRFRFRRCDYVWISEPPYEDVSGTPFCGLYAPITYRSSTRTLSITLLYSQSHKHAFTLEYTAESKQINLTRISRN